MRQPAQPSARLWDRGYSRVESLLKVREARRRQTRSARRSPGARRWRRTRERAGPWNDQCTWPAVKNAKIVILLRCWAEAHTHRQIERELMSHRDDCYEEAAMQSGAGSAILKAEALQV